MSESPDERAVKYAKAIMDFIHLMAYVASPRIVAKVGQMPAQEHFLQHADSYIEVVEASKSCPDAPGNRATIAAEPYARKLRELLRAWMPSSDVPSDIRDTARELLAAAGFGAPPEGWDAFEGPPAEDEQPPLKGLAGPGPYTWEDYLVLAEDDPRELIDGHLIATEPLGETYAHVVAHLHVYLVAWADNTNGGRVRGSSNKLKIDPHCGIRPDLHFYRSDNPVARIEKAVVSGRPDLVVEVVVPSRERLVRGIMFLHCRSLAVPEYWILDPEGRVLERYLFHEGRYEFVEVREREEVFCPDTFAPLEIPLARLWKT